MKKNIQLKAYSPEGKRSKHDSIFSTLPPKKIIIADSSAEEIEEFFNSNEGLAVTPKDNLKIKIDIQREQAKSWLERRHLPFDSRILYVQTEKGGIVKSPDQRGKKLNIILQETHSDIPGAPGAGSCLVYLDAAENCLNKNDLLQGYIYIAEALFLNELLVVTDLELNWRTGRSRVGPAQEKQSENAQSRKDLGEKWFSELREKKKGIVQSYRIIENRFKTGYEGYKGRPISVHTIRKWGLSSNESN